MVDFLSGNTNRGGAGSGRRYFGKGDIMRDATLVFGDNAYVEIESIFEKCAITLGNGAELVVAREGILRNCSVSGAGRVTVHGFFSETESGPGLIGPRQLFVSSKGSIISKVQQTAQATKFGFEPGCRLRLTILEANTAK